MGLYTGYGFGWNVGQYLRVIIPRFAQCCNVLENLTPV